MKENKPVFSNDGVNQQAKTPEGYTLNYRNDPEMRQKEIVKLFEKADKIFKENGGDFLEIVRDLLSMDGYSAPLEWMPEELKKAIKDRDLAKVEDMAHNDGWL